MAAEAMTTTYKFEGLAPDVVVMAPSEIPDVPDSYKGKRILTIARDNGDKSTSLKAYKKWERGDSERDDSDAGNPCGDSTDGEESTADGDSLPGGGRDSDSSSGELSTADDDSPTGGQRDRVTSSSGGGSAADDVSPNEGRRDSDRSNGDISTVDDYSTIHRQEAAPPMTFHHTKASAAAFAAATAEALPPMTFHHTKASANALATAAAEAAQPMDDASPKENLKEPQGIPVAYQAANQVSKASANALATAAAEAAQPMDDASPKENLKEPQGIPVAYQAANQVSKGKHHERGGSSPVQAAIRSAIAASGSQRARPAGSAEVKAEMLVPALTAVLGHLVALGCRKQRVSIFHAKRVPQVSLVDYLRRIAAYYPCSDQGLVLGLIYLDRLLVKHPDFVVSGLSVHRLLATAMTLSSKFLNDISYRNEHYAKVAGMQAKELSFLEAHFLKLLDWRLNVSAEEFDEYQKSIMAAYPRGLIAHGPAAPQVKRE